MHLDLSNTFSIDFGASPIILILIFVANPYILEYPHHIYIICMIYIRTSAQRIIDQNQIKNQQAWRSMGRQGSNLTN